MKQARGADSFGAHGSKNEYQWDLFVIKDLKNQEYKFIYDEANQKWSQLLKATKDCRAWRYPALIEPEHY